MTWFDVDLMGILPQTELCGPTGRLLHTNHAGLIFNFPAIAIGMDLHLVVCDCTLQPFHQNIVVQRHHA